MIIGVFRRDAESNNYTGSINVIGFERVVDFQRVASKTAAGPDYLVVSHPQMEIGAAWRRTGKDGDYVSVKLDSPLLAQPVNCALVGQPNGTLALVWHREKTKERPATVDTATAA
jgi:uncharacterized protein (DUF736 family)